MSWPALRPIAFAAMSEDSGSIHVRTDDSAGCTARLAQFGFNGFVFDHTPGWLTAVPFGGPAGLFAFHEWIAQLAGRLDAPVLAYSCADDFFWSFSVWLPDGVSTSFMASMPEVADMAGEPGKPPDEAVLAAICHVDDVRSFLVPVIDGPGGASKPAHAFAAAIGLTDYAFLSPSYVTDDPAEATGRGGRQIGVPPLPEEMR